MRGSATRGSALLPAVAVLSLLALLAAMSLLAAGADLLLSTRLGRERAAVFAADGALEAGLAGLATPGAVAERTFSPPYPSPVPAVRSWREGPWSCRAVVRTLADAADADGDPDSPVVLFDRSFGYAGSPRPTGGFPVLQLLVTAEDGEARAAAVAEVTPVPCLPPAGAAWTAGGALTLAGAVRVSGAGGGVPAVLARGEVTVESGAVLEGPDGDGRGAAVVEPGAPVPVDALEALGAGGRLARLEDLPAPADPGPLRGVAWSPGDWRGPLEGEGILVVHNPAFDPVRHEASRLALEEGVLLDAWDPGYSHLDPARRPAELAPGEGGEFRGVVIADRVGPPGAPLTVAGAVITLSRSPLRLAADSALEVRYDRGALERAGRGPLRLVTARRVLPPRAPVP